ncbi:MAG: Rne/Rng family ribonuclease [Opitutales bacterium]|nr:Rne/Rng family ribonuclease [Opitutales bacterium]
METQDNLTDEQIASHNKELSDAPEHSDNETIQTKNLKEAAQQRAKKLPLVQKIAKNISGGSSDFTEIVVNSEPLEKRVALIKNGILEKFEVERFGDERMVGTIFRGKIQNLEPGLKAAFVDIGQSKNAFLHYWDILPAANDNSVEIVRDNESEDKKKAKQKITIKDIPTKYPIGADIMVQITKASIGNKGPRTTTNIAIPGQFLVLMPFSGQCGISRKIQDKAERTRLKRILKDLTIPDGMGVIMRTAGEGMKERYFVRDLYNLVYIWQKIQERWESTDEPCKLYEEPDIIYRTGRDFLTSKIDRVQIDDKEAYQSVVDYVARVSPRSKSKIIHFKEDIPIFERFNIEKQITQTFQRKVPLPSGGEIVIEETEALVAVDVNTGGHKGANKDGKDFILHANLEAAVEVARQIRLRNVGGLIIIDFIDMKQRKDRNSVYMKMKHEMKKDKAKCHILPISQLGIMQMSRQRHKESTSSGIYTTCHYCSGRGILKSDRTMSVEIQRKLISSVRHLRQTSPITEKKRLYVLLHPLNLQRLKQEDEEILVDMEREQNISLTFRADPAIHVENFRIVDAKTGQEIR